MRTLAHLGVVLAVVAAVAACSEISRALTPPARPQPCGDVFNDVRCLAIRDSAASSLGTTREDVVGVTILPDPTPEIVDGKTILHTTSGGRSIELVVSLADGSSHGVTIQCAGIPEDPGCFDHPHLRAWSPTQGGGGYRDVPEGSSPVPPAAPSALARASELRIDRLDIPIDHSGPTEVRIGELALPNGLLTTADLALVDDWPSGVTILHGGVGLVLRSLEDGSTIENIYAHGWQEGTERVEAVLVFDVFRYDPGATLGIRDVVVR